MSLQNNKKVIFIIAVVILIILGAVVYLVWKKPKTEKLEGGVLDKTGETVEKISESAAKGILPSIQINPLEDKPDINPVSKTNPFGKIKTNPFE